VTPLFCPAPNAVSTATACAIISSTHYAARGHTEEVGERRVPFDSWRFTTPFALSASFPIFLPLTKTKEMMK